MSTDTPLPARETVPDADSPDEVEHDTPHDDPEPGTTPEPEPDDGPNADDGDDGSG